MHKKWFAPLIVSIIIVIISITCLIFITLHWSAKEISINNQAINKVQDNPQSLDLKGIIHEAEKNVVQIEGQNKHETITGSGFLYNDQGDIVTNAHVIKDADVIQVRTANAHVYPAAVVGTGENTDIAVIRVPQLAAGQYLSVEKKAIPEIGDEVIALGSPHGFQNTVTLGIISGDKRNFSADGFDYTDVYQISAQITHGNSGGPLINRETGKVIGINAAGTEDGSIGFSIPIIDVIDQIEQWSNEIQNDQLDFADTTDILSKADPEQLKEDVEYLVDYFFDSVKIRDYLSAYTLLGSKMQSETSYTEFREAYIPIVELNYTEMSIEVTEESNFKAVIDVTIKKQTKQEKKDTEKVQYTFTIGLENDQLKILQTNTPKDK